MTFKKIIIFTSYLSFLGPLVIAQNNYDKPEIMAKKAIYNVQKTNTSIIVENKNNKARKEKLTYDDRHLDYSGFDFKAIQRYILNAFRIQLSERQKSVMRKQGIRTIAILLRKNGKIDEVSFILPLNTPITPDDLEKIEKAITKLSVPVLKPNLYTNVNWLLVSIAVDGSLL